MFDPDHGARAAIHHHAHHGCELSQARRHRNRVDQNHDRADLRAVCFRPAPAPADHHRGGFPSNPESLNGQQAGTPVNDFHGCRLIVAAAVRVDGAVSFPVRAADARPRRAAWGHGECLCDDRPRDLAGDDEILGTPVRHQLRDGRRHRHHDGIPVRNELGLLQPLRRGHFRRAAGDRRPDGVFSGSDIHRAVLLWLGQAHPSSASVRDLAGGARLKSFGTVDSDRQWLDAVSGRREIQSRHHADGSHRLHAGAVQSGGAGEIRPYRQRRLRHRRDVRACPSAPSTCSGAGTSNWPSGR